MIQKQQVIINIGISGAGKSTWSVDYMKKHPEFIRISRDAIRLTIKGSLDGYYQEDKDRFNNLEKLVNKTEDGLFIQALNRGFSIIIDNSNLKPSYIQRWVDFVNIYNNSVSTRPEEVEFKFKIFPENNIDLLKKRVNIRDIPKNFDSLDYINKQASSIRSAIAYVEDNYKSYIYE